MNLIKASSLNELAANIIIEELFRNKCECFFISPGSRSTPLTTAVGYRDDLQKQVHFDERGSAFQALGYARATLKPGVLICTSGSATANYFPAICEAMADSVPMIVLTADRPPELHNVLANQTFEQSNLYGDKVKNSITLQPPTDSISLEKLLHDVSTVIQQATSYPMGPVHINCMFREPLTPTDRQREFSKLTKTISTWIKSQKPFEKLPSKKTKLPDSVAFDKTLPTILIVGALQTKREADAVLAFAEKQNLPIFADARSRLRLHKRKNIINYYDQILLTMMLKDIDCLQVFHVGGNIVSKRLLEFVEKTNIKSYVVLHNSLVPFNAHHKMTEHYCGDINKLLQQLSKDIKPFEKKYLNKFIKNNSKVKSIIENYKLNFSEISITRELSQIISKNRFIYSANSLAIRLLDMFADSTDVNNLIIANRGLSGIDGTIASAVGYANGINKKGIVLIGDLAFQHDINSLALLKCSKQPLVIVLLNNNGGKIFSYLPIAKNKKVYNQYFETPQNMTFEATAMQYDLHYSLVRSQEQFSETYKKVEKFKKSFLIEVALQDSDVYKEHKKITQEIRKIDR